jgi:tetratricopeptide (TPR) repeat protein
MVNFQLGNFEAARDSFERGLALSDLETDQPHFFTHGQNPGTFCASFLAYTLWFLGYPDRAKAMVESNLAIAQKRSKEPSHVYSFVNALTYAVRTHQNRGEAALTKSLAGELLAISRRNHYEYYEALAIAHLGWANSIEQSLDIGIDQVRQGIAAIVRTGTVNTLPGFYSRLAELYVRARQPDEAFQALQAAKAKNRRSMLFWDAELERIGGEALLLTDAGDTARAVAASSRDQLRSAAAPGGSSRGRRRASREVPSLLHRRTRHGRSDRGARSGGRAEILRLMTSIAK